MLTIDVDSSIRGPSIDEALSCGVQGGEVGSDERGQHSVAPVGHQAVVLGVPHIVLPCWVLLPPVVPATESNTWVMVLCV